MIVLGIMHDHDDPKAPDDDPSSTSDSNGTAVPVPLGSRRGRRSHLFPQRRQAPLASQLKCKGVHGQQALEVEVSGVVERHAVADPVRFALDGRGGGLLQRKPVARPPIRLEEVCCDVVELVQRGHDGDEVGHAQLVRHELNGGEDRFAGVARLLEVLLLLTRERRLLVVGVNKHGDHPEQGKQEASHCAGRGMGDGTTTQI